MTDTNLQNIIDYSNVWCLNESEEHKISNALKGSDYTESDADSDLLIFIPFKEKVNIKKLEISGVDEKSFPTSLKIFVNTSNMDFDDVEKKKAILEAKLKKIKETIQTKDTAFGQCNSITIAIKENSSKDSSIPTKISNLNIFGIVNKGLDMNNWSSACKS